MTNGFSKNPHADCCGFAFGISFIISPRRRSALNLRWLIVRAPQAGVSQSSLSTAQLRDVPRLHLQLVQDRPNRLKYNR
jgi:hypothetical protein